VVPWKNLSAAGERLLRGLPLLSFSAMLARIRFLVGRPIDAFGAKQGHKTINVFDRVNRSD